MAEAHGIGPGERAERARKKRFRVMLGMLFAVGLVTGGVVGAAEGELISNGGNLLEATIPGWLAILLTAIFLVSLGVGTVALTRSMDEHTRAEQLWFTAFGASTFVIVYPAWFLLWKGRLLPEPHHLILFLLFYAGAVLGYLARYVRSSR